MALSKNSKIEVADINAISSTASSALSTANTANTNATNAYNLANSKQDALGFTPIQQGGGHGQGTNKIYIGWSGSQLKCTVDQTDIGAFSFGSGGTATTINANSVFVVGNSRATNCTIPSGGTWKYLRIYYNGGSTSYNANIVSGGTNLADTWGCIAIKVA